MRVLSRLPERSMFGLYPDQSNPIESPCKAVLFQRCSQAGNPATVAFKGPSVHQLLCHAGQLEGDGDRIENLLNSVSLCKYQLKLKAESLLVTYGIHCTNWSNSVCGRRQFLISKSAVWAR